MTIEMRQAFELIGAEVQVETQGRVFEIDVLQDGQNEVFRLKYPQQDVITAEAIDVQPKRRHLVLDVSGWRLPISGRYLCGHDEFHWFVASLPFDQRTATVRGAMEGSSPRRCCESRHGSSSPTSSGWATTGRSWFASTCSLTPRRRPPTATTS